MNTKFWWRKILCVGILAVVMVVAPGCKHKKQTTLTPPIDDSGLTAQSKTRRGRASPTSTWPI